MGRKPCCEKVGLKRGPWTIDEDHKLMTFILNNGIHCWRLVPKLAGLARCGKSCRLRWINYLRPDLKRGGFTEHEEEQIIELHSRLGNRWSKIASYFPGRTDNEIKNHWNTRIKKKMRLLGLDPLTHRPIDEVKKNNTHLEKTELEPVSDTTIDDAFEDQVEDKRGFLDDKSQNNTSVLRDSDQETYDELPDCSYQELCRDLDLEVLLATTELEKNTSSLSGIPTFPLGEWNTSNFSSSNSYSIQDDALLNQWMEDSSFEPLETWDLFVNFEENTFHFGK